MSYSVEILEQSVQTAEYAVFSKHFPAAGYLDNILKFILLRATLGIQTNTYHVILYIYTYIRLFHVAKGLFTEICDKQYKYNKINAMRIKV